MYILHLKVSIIFRIILVNANLRHLKQNCEGLCYLLKVVCLSLYLRIINWHFIIYTFNLYDTRKTSIQIKPNIKISQHFLWKSNHTYYLNEENIYVTCIKQQTHSFSLVIYSSWIFESHNC